MNESRPKTIICDIDGVLLKHLGDGVLQHKNIPIVLPGTVEKIQEWDRKGYNIILITGRRESTREYTAKQLSDCGIVYDQLIMGVGGGVRVLINDKKPESDDPTALAFSPVRNVGLDSVDI